MEEMSRAGQEAHRSRVRGCLLGGAIGDALGAPIEFDSLDRIRQVHGAEGITDLVPLNGKRGLITDDTQMTLFTVEGLIRASVRYDRGIVHIPSVVHRAYLRWLLTQGIEHPKADRSGRLVEQQWLFAQRAPGNACLTGLRRETMGTREEPSNPNSKGCGAVMRSAPFGLLPREKPQWAFDFAVECAVQTHGHPTGYLAAGAFAALISHLTHGAELREAVGETRQLLQTYDGHEETLAALDNAIDAAAHGARAETLETLGGGWVAEEALAIGLYCALVHPSYGSMREALLLAVNHSGDSDSTGSICGNILGALHGETALPPDWLIELEGRGTILELADDLALEFTQQRRLHGDYGPFTRWTDRYPGS